MRASKMTTREYNYRLNCTEYVLHQGDTPVGPLLQEVALAFDHESGTLHKHGAPDLVKTWARETALKLKEAGAEDLVSGLLVITGRFPLAELNRCLSTSGYVGLFYKQLCEGRILEEP